MGLVAKRQSGFIFKDSFDAAILDPAWEISPNDPTRCSLTDVTGVLRLKHGDSTVYAFLTQLTSIKQFVLDVKNTYNPTAAGDVGGIIVYGDNSDYISLDEYYDAAQGTTQTYNWLRLVRDYNTYYGYWSDDGFTWTALGSQEFDNPSPRIGLFLSGATGVDFDAEEVRVMAGTKLSLDNVAPGKRVELLDSTGVVLDTLYGLSNSTQVKFDMSKYELPLTARIRVEGMNDLPDTYPLWGGDSYAVNYTLDLSYIDDEGVRTPLDGSMEKFLGYLNIGAAGSKQVQMFAKNSFTTGDFTSVQISTADYKGTGQYTDMVKLALDVSGAPGTPEASITLPNIPANTEQTFWLTLSRATDVAHASSEVYFGLAVTTVFI